MRSSNCSRARFALFYVGLAPKAENGSKDFRIKHSISVSKLKIFFSKAQNWLISVNLTIFFFEKSSFLGFKKDFSIEGVPLFARVLKGIKFDEKLGYFSTENVRLLSES